MSLKDNFNQAIREVLKKDDKTAKNKKKTEIEEILEPTSLREELAAIKEAATVIPEEKNAFIPEEETATAASSEPVSNSFSSFSQYSPRQATEQSASATPNYSQSAADFGTTTPPPSPKKPPLYSQREQDNAYYETEETTIISRNTIIDGNIRSFANINVDGSVKGNVAITKNINVSGKIVGDIECNNSSMIGASMQGNINSRGQVQIDRDTLLLGDISAQFLDLNGKIKGNIDCGGKAEFKTDAVIMGNITASTITVLDGATIQGYVNTTFLQESSSSIFPEVIALGD